MILNALVSTSDLVSTPQSQVDRASARVRAYCGWHISPEVTETLTLDTAGGQVLWLPTLYLGAVAGVTLTAPDSPAVDLADITFSRAGMVILGGAYWPTGFGAVEMLITHGYETLPPEIADVVIALSQRLPTQSAGVVSEAAGGVSRTYGPAGSGFTLAESAVLERYKLNARP